VSAVFDTIDELRQLSGIHDAVVVACSFGKDSLIALDLCAKHFKRVECLHLVYVHGLELTAKRIEYVKQRWGIDTLVKDHPASLANRHDGYRCFPDASIQKKTFRDVFAEAKAELNCSLMVTGMRASEGISRRGAITRGKQGLKVADYFGDYQPLAFWRHSKEHSDLLPYLRNNNIEPFEPLAGSKHGMSNSAESILQLHDNHHSDYLRWLEVYPLASCVVKRRELYGIA
jgi:phosphoadenosine phosphosulfate reductase